MAGGAGVKHSHDSTKFKHEPVAMFCYFMMGCGFLTGWNAFLQVTDYFNAVFPNRSIDRVFTIVYLPITFVLIGLVSRFKNILWTGRIRILTAYTLFTLCSAVVPVIDAGLIQGSSHAPESAYALVLLAVALIAVSDGISQGTVYGDAALLPDIYTRCVVMGAAASGVIIGVIRIVTKGALPQTFEGLRTSTQIYFAVAALITAVCIVLYELVMPKLDVVEYYRGKLQDEVAAADLAARRMSETSSVPLSRDSFISLSITGDRLVHRTSLTNRPSSPGSISSITSPTAAAAAAAVKTADTAAAHDARSVTSPAALNHKNLAALEDGQAHSVTRNNTPSNTANNIGNNTENDIKEDLGVLTWTKILRLNWRLCVAVIILYAVTLSIFPGFLAENVSSATLKDWYPVLLIFSFNIADFLGRCTPSCGWLPSQTILLLICIARLIVLETLYPVLAIKGAGEAVFFILTLLLGYSNGYLTAQIFMAAPRGLNPSAAETAGMINVFCELGGLNIGAYLGWLWTIGNA